jgi:hypothetical protein
MATTALEILIAPILWATVAGMVLGAVIRILIDTADRWCDRREEKAKSAHNAVCTSGNRGAAAQKPVSRRHAIGLHG